MALAMHQLLRLLLRIHRANNMYVLFTSAESLVLSYKIARSLIMQFYMSTMHKTMQVKE